MPQKSEYTEQPEQNKDTQTIDARNEVKIVINSIYVPTARSMALLHPAGFHQAFPPRKINNVYFDTPELDSFYENIDGISGRKKFRLRWYGDKLQIEKSVLEIKNKRNKYNWKTSFEINTPIDFTTMRWTQIMDIIKNHLPPEALIEFNDFFYPVIINSYKREYYESADKLIRLTIDCNQKAFEQRSRMVPAFSQNVIIEDYAIIELKSSLHNQKYLSEVINDLHLRPSRNSKYANSLRLIVLS